ncbi:MAG: DUF1285 domain-containing protein [Brevundimonas sp.]
MTPDTLSLIQSVAGHAEGGRGPAPVHLWNPDNCGAMDLVIRADGVWMHEGSPIGRPQLVRLLATVLRKDADGYYLVTPVEKLKITVEDVPFRAVRVDRAGDDLVFTTDMGDQVTAGAEHPLRVETDSETGEPTPYVHVRGDLEARIERPVFYELVEMADLADGRMTVRSGGVAFTLGDAR